MFSKFGINFGYGKASCGGHVHPKYADSDSRQVAPGFGSYILSMNPGHFFKLLLIRLLTIPVVVFWAFSLLCMHVSAAMMKTSDKLFRYCTTDVFASDAESTDIDRRWAK